MRKLKLLVAGLCLSGAICANSSDSTTVSKENLQQIDYILDDLLSAVRMDMHYGYLREERGNDYINQIIELMIKNKQLITN